MDGTIEEHTLEVQAEKRKLVVASEQPAYATDRNSTDWTMMNDRCELRSPRKAARETRRKADDLRTSGSSSHDEAAAIMMVVGVYQYSEAGSRIVCESSFDRNWY